MLYRQRLLSLTRENKEHKKLNERLMERKEAARKGELEQDLKGLIKTKKPFTGERLSYMVPVASGHKTLLNEVHGYVLVSGRFFTFLASFLVKRAVLTSWFV